MKNGTNMLAYAVKDQPDGCGGVLLVLKKDLTVMKYEVPNAH